MTIGTRRHHQTKDSNMQSTEIRTICKPYSSKRLPKKAKGQRIYVSLATFKKDLHIFDPELSTRYTNAQVVEIMSLILKKAAERIVKKLWRMPFPNGAGLLYMKEAQISCGPTSQGRVPKTDGEIEALLRRIRLGHKRVFLKWNKDRIRLPYMDIWTAKRSNGFFRSLLHAEVVKRAEDPTQSNYRGHIM